MQTKPVPAGLGVNTHFFKGSDRDWSMLAESGISVVRTDVSWQRFERSPGQYDFRSYDALIGGLERHGMWLIWVVSYGNPIYDPDTRARANLGIHNATARQACARFCTALAKRYKDKKIIWELWNEPNLSTFWGPKPNADDYVAWCKVVAASIRKVDPGACLVGPALSRFYLPFIERCFEQGLLEVIDGVTVHPYRGGVDRFPRIVRPKARLPLYSDPESAYQDYDRLRGLIERYKPAGKGMPILSGEWGYSTTYVTHELQGKYLARQWLANMAYGVPVSIWYDWHDDGPDPNDMEHNFGTISYDYKPQPAYLAMKTLIAQLRGYMPIGRVKLDNQDDFAVVFRKGDACKLAIWTRGESHEIVLPSRVAVSNGVDYVGRPVDVSNGSRQPVDDAPRYLTLAPPIPAWLKAPRTAAGSSR